MDSTIKTNERQAATGDKVAEARAIAARIRMGEIPAGAIVTLDSTSHGGPRKLTGTWKVCPRTWQREGYVGLHRVGRRTGRELKSSAANLETISEAQLRAMLVKVEPPRVDVVEAKVERAPEGAPIVRAFSAAGPCLTQGRLVRTTAKFYVIEVARGWGKAQRYENKRLAIGNGRLVHTEPCRSCTDHAQTQYPRGYEN